MNHVADGGPSTRNSVALSCCSTKDRVANTDLSTSRHNSSSRFLLLRGKGVGISREQQYGGAGRGKDVGVRQGPVGHRLKWPSPGRSIPDISTAHRVGRA
eukprot:3893662-Rhodomonas_salina.1